MIFSQYQCEIKMIVHIFDKGLLDSLISIRASTKTCRTYEHSSTPWWKIWKMVIFFKIPLYWHFHKNNYHFIISYILVVSYTWYVLYISIFFPGKLWECGRVWYVCVCVCVCVCLYLCVYVCLCLFMFKCMCVSC